MAFVNIEDPDAEFVEGEYKEYRVGSTLWWPISGDDYDDDLDDWVPFDFSSGYTARMVLRDPNGDVLMTFTQALSSGRQLDMSDPLEQTIAISATPAAMAGVEPWVGYQLPFSIAITHTASGTVMTPIRECFLDIRPEND